MRYAMEMNGKGRKSRTRFGIKRRALQALAALLSLAAAVAAGCAVMLPASTLDERGGAPYDGGVTRSPGVMKFKINVFDRYTGEAVPGVPVEVIYRGTSGTTLFTETSDVRGVAYREMNYSSAGNNYQIMLGGVAVDGVGSHRFDFGPAGGSGFSLDISADGRIRRFAGGEHTHAREGVTGSGARYDDAQLNNHGSARHPWIDEGATVEMDLWVADNRGYHDVIFDVDGLSNGADFPSVTAAHGDAAAEPQPEPQSDLYPADRWRFEAWYRGGQPYDFSSPVVCNVGLTPHFVRTAYGVEFDTSRIADPDGYSPFTVAAGQSVGDVTSLPDPVNRDDPSLVFSHWTAGGEVFDPSAPLTDDVTLVPVWEGDGPRGIIHFEVYMWDHDAYWSAPKTKLPAPVTVNGVTGNYRAEDYLSNDGWTSIPVEGLDFVLKTYADDPAQIGGGYSGGIVEDSLKSPVGTTDWSESRVTTDAAGRATYEIDGEGLSLLTPDWRIDTDPDSSDMARYDRGTGYGMEETTFDWDWYVKGADGAGAGLVGVRYIREGARHDNSGVLISGRNDNDNAYITQDMRENGFEFTFVCYVVPACTVKFDLDGGSPPGGASWDSYAMQTISPVDSTGSPVETFFAVRPPDPAKDGSVFAGWYEVRYLYDGNTGEYTEYLDSEHYDFDREVTHSMTLRAVYTDRLYTARWVTPGWEAAGFPDSPPSLIEMRNSYPDGERPSYDSDLPGGYTDGGVKYAFSGWDLYVADSAGEKDFGPAGRYAFSAFVPLGEMTRMTAGGGEYYLSPAPIDGADQVYVARFEPVEKTVTVSKSVTNGMGSFPFELSVTGPGGEPVSLASAGVVLPDGVTLKEGSAETAVFSLGDGESLALSLPVSFNGQPCLFTVRETDPRDFDASYSVDGGGAVRGDATDALPVGETDTVSFVNGREVVPVTVTKTVVNGSGTFRFTASVTKNGEPVDLRGVSGQTAVLSGDLYDKLSFSLGNGDSETLYLPAGCDLTVTEEHREGFVTEYSVGGDAAEGNSAVIAGVSGGETVEFINTGTVLPSLTVRKTVAGAATEEKFLFSLELYDGDGERIGDLSALGGENLSVDGDTATFLLGDGEEIVITSVPSGATAVVTETSHPGYLASYRIGDSSSREGDACTVPALGGDVAVTFTNRPGFELPATGGSGTFLYTLGGCALMASALMLGLTLGRTRERRAGKQRSF